ncbi:MAG: acetate kinase [Alphaproteobacteria bacterium]|nr:acetate kinase [Alphaproteobacteria bacterium]
MTKILVINCGSSTIKYQLFNMDSKEVLCSGLVEKIGESISRITHKKFPDTDKATKTVIEERFPTHAEGMRKAVDMMMNGETAVISDISEIGGVGHRIVHGGSYVKPMIVTDEVKANLEKVIPLAPLHNPAHLIGINVAQEIFPNAKHVVVFDTAFHQTMPDYAFMYPLPYEIYEKYAVRKYGAHGTSHKYVARRCAQLLNKPLDQCNFITCHIGSGSSVSAIKNGLCIDTSMGLTPLDGLMMGTRCGSIDLATVGFLMRNAGLNIDEVDKMMTQQSGLIGICGVNDMRDVHAKIAAGDKKAKLALDMLTYRIRSFIGAYFAQLNGQLDALVWTAGVGENDEIVRKEVVNGLTGLGFKLDENANNQRPGEYALISAPDSKFKIYVIRTNEELEIANETLALM